MNAQFRSSRGRPHPVIAGLAVGVLAAATVVAVAVPPVQAQPGGDLISVDFSVTSGAPTHRASGWIYGMTEDGSGPADHFFTDVNFRYLRAGGAQLASPGGWANGGYERRWNSTLAQAQRTAALGGEFILLPHDLWGADGYPISRFPGDNGDWTDYDAFLDRVISDVQAAGLTVQWDIWNEPNITLFWNRPWEQYFELWRRSYQRIRAAFPDQLIVGPSCACVPSTTHSFWNQFLDYIQANNVVPDIISWHSLPGDPVANVAAADATLDPRGIPHPLPYQINEYAAPHEQNPADGSWYIARLERAGADGLRANWASGNLLHDNLADLLLQDPAGQHLPKGEWWVYRFYGSQTGQVVSVTPSGSYDAFATKAPGEAKVLVGGRGTSGNLAVDLQRLDTTGIVENNQVRVVVQLVPFGNGGAVQGPVTIRDSTVDLSGSGTTVDLPHTNRNDAFTITLLPPSNGSFQSVAVAQHSQQCLDNTDLSTADGNQQQQFHCEGGGQQLWNFHPVTGAVDTYTVANEQSGKCLDVEGAASADGAAVTQWACNGSLSQQFSLREVTYPGHEAYDYQLVAQHSGKCVDVSAISTQPRAPVHQWTCNPADQDGPLNQTWRLWGSPTNAPPPPPPPSGELVSVNADRCLDVPGQSTTTGTQVQIWDCWGGANQQWAHTSSGELTVYSGGSLRCLDAEGAGTANGTAVIIWTCHGGANQRWNLNANGTITNAQSGLCLDVSGYGTTNGSQVHLWSCHGGTNQQWTRTGSL